MTAPCDLIIEQMGLLFTCSQEEQYTRIQTPYLYPDGDIIDIFFREKGDTITITDLGESQRWLKMQTVTRRKSHRQQQLIADICLTHNVELYRGMLQARVHNLEDLSATIVKVAQCALRVSDVWFTQRNRLSESIADDVEEQLQERLIPFSRSPQIPGRSTRIWRPDFQTRSKDQSALIQVLSTGSHSVAREQVTRATAMWYDLSHLKIGTTEMSFISLIDDTEDVWSQEDILLVEGLSDIAYWSHADTFFEKIA